VQGSLPQECLTATTHELPADPQHLSFERKCVSFFQGSLQPPLTGGRLTEAGDRASLLSHREHILSAACSRSPKQHSCSVVGAAAPL